jgi:hypothetical protein
VLLIREFPEKTFNSAVRAARDLCQTGASQEIVDRLSLTTLPSFSTPSIFIIHVYSTTDWYIPKSMILSPPDDATACNLCSSMASLNNTELVAPTLPTGKIPRKPPPILKSKRMTRAFAGGYGHCGTRHVTMLSFTTRAGCETAEIVSVHCFDAQSDSCEQKSPALFPRRHVLAVDRRSTLVGSCS